MTTLRYDHKWYKILNIPFPFSLSPLGVAQFFNALCTLLSLCLHECSPGQATHKTASHHVGPSLVFQPQYSLHDPWIQHGWFVCSQRSNRAMVRPCSRSYLDNLLVVVSRWSGSWRSVHGGVGLTEVFPPIFMWDVVHTLSISLTTEMDRPKVHHISQLFS